MSDLEATAREALERAEKATEGPWEAANGTDVYCDDDPVYPVAKTFKQVMGRRLGTFAAEDNAEFIAWCRNNIEGVARGVLELLEERERLRRVRLSAESVLDAYDAGFTHHAAFGQLRQDLAREALAKEPGEEQ